MWGCMYVSAYVPMLGCMCVHLQEKHQKVRGSLDTLDIVSILSRLSLMVTWQQSGVPDSLKGLPAPSSLSCLLAPAPSPHSPPSSLHILIVRA